MPPSTKRPAADEPEAVVRVDRRGAGIARTGERPDDALAVEGGAEALVLDVPLDDVGDRRVEHHVTRLGIVGEQLLERGAVGRGPDPDVAARSEPEPVADALEQRLVVRGTRRRPRARSRPPKPRCDRESCHWNSDDPSSNGVHWVGSTTNLR